MKQYLILALWLACLTARALDPSQLGDVASRYASGAPADALQQIDAAIASLPNQPSLQADLESVLIRMLVPDATPEARLFACERLAFIGTDRSLPALGNLLLNPESTSMACLALTPHPSPRASLQLRSALQSLQGPPRVQVIRALAMRRDVAATKILSRLVRSEDSNAAAAAVVALGAIGGSTAERTLGALRSKPPSGLEDALDEASLRLAEGLAASRRSTAAIRLLQQLLDNGRSRQVRAGAFRLAAHMDPRWAGRAIPRYLQGSDPDLRAAAIASVGLLKSNDAPQAIARLLDSLPSAQQPLLVEALADFGPRAPRKTLAECLGSTNAEVRMAAVQAFARLNDPRDVPSLAQAARLAHSNAERQAVENALVQLPGKAATDTALRTAFQEAPHPVLAAALSRRGDPDSVPLLASHTTPAGTPLARAAWQGLGRLGHDADVPLLLEAARKSPSGEAEAAIARVLNRIPQADLRYSALAKALAAAAEPANRAFLIRLLPQAGTRAALDATRAGLSSGDEPVRVAALNALAEWPDMQAWSDLLTFCTREAQGPARAISFRGLVRLAAEQNSRPTPELIGQYQQLSKLAADAAERRLVLGALGACPHPEALKLAQESIGSLEVGTEARQAVRRIAEAIKGSHTALAEEALRRLGTGN